MLSSLLEVSRTVPGTVKHSNVVIQTGHSNGLLRVRAASCTQNLNIIMYQSVCINCDLVCPQCERVASSDELQHNPNCTACKGQCPPRNFWYGSGISKRTLVTICVTECSSEGWYPRTETDSCVETMYETGLRNAQRRTKRTKYEWVFRPNFAHKVSPPLWCHL
jgi:hypothetical protein